MFEGGSMKVSHIHCGVRDLPAAARWFEQVWQVAPVFHNERMAWLSFGEFGLILDAARTDSVVTLSFDSEDCDVDYRTVTDRGAETIEAPQNRPWGARATYLRGPGGLTVEIEQLLKRT
jgi:predicted enzyme related to lactoylglutathione lyase